MAMTHLGMQAGTMKLPNEFLELLHSLGQLYTLLVKLIPLYMRGMDGGRGTSNRPTLSNT